MTVKNPVSPLRDYNPRYAKKVTIMLGDIDRLQLAVGSGDDYLLWLELKGIRRGAIDAVRSHMREARELLYLLRGLAEEDV